jgi:homoserine O-succinyltransferase/O-acetyltransferase
MPLSIDMRPSAPTNRATDTPRSVLEIGLINNMPDGALEPTERQFSQLLAAAAGALPVRLSFYALPEISRAPAARKRLELGYSSLETLWHSNLDALIITGAEPRAPELPQEPYWGRLVEILEWSRSNVSSTIWSCLAAHAAVLHLDGITRRPLQQKCCGVFEHQIDANHAITRGVEPLAPTPHSRWNDLDGEALRRCGYDLLACSATAGVNLFAKRLGDCRLVFWQGHPEYDERSLLKEYQRDVSRYLTGERSAYPTLPQNYFAEPAAERLQDFERRALATRSPHLLSDFPLELAAAGLTNRWRPAAVQVYGNWLRTVARAKNR